MRKGSTSAETEVIREHVPIDRITPDVHNRRIVEDDDFDLLCDSIRVLGILQPRQVLQQADGTYRLIDGERRWRAACKAGLETIPCDVWPEGADLQRASVAAIILNEHRAAHGCLHVARRLRDIKNDGGLSHEELAKKTGLPLDRVKTYFALFAGSEDLLVFLDEEEVPLKVAAEFVRFEKATNEARARRLMERHLESPLTVQEIVSLRKAGADGGKKEKAAPARRPIERLVDRLEAEARRSPDAIGHLEDLALRLGYRLVPAGDAPHVES
jgi:ParB family chromosome partitioning protein